MKNLAFLRYEVSRCGSETESRLKIKCKPPDKINDLLTRRSYINVFLLKPLVDPSNYSNAVKPSYNHNALNLATFDVTRKMSYTSYYYRIANLTSDTGLLFSDKNGVNDVFLEYQEQFSEYKVLGVIRHHTIVAAYSFYISNIKAQYKFRSREAQT